MWNIGSIFAIAFAGLAASTRPAALLAGTQTVPGARLAPADGRALFMEHCASCHGTTARGDGPVAASLRDFPGDLTQFAKRNGGVFPSAKVLRIIEGRDVGAHGSGEMPVWGHVFRRMPSDTSDGSPTERIEAIVRYLESIQERAGHEDPAGHR